MLIMASVATKGGTRSFAMLNAVTVPQMPPTTREVPKITSRLIGIPAFGTS